MFKAWGWPGNLDRVTFWPGLPRNLPDPAESGINSLATTSTGLFSSNTSTGTLEALLGNMF